MNGSKFAPATYRCHQLPAAIILIASLGSASAIKAGDAEFLPLGDLPGGRFESYGVAVSDDGRIVVGLGFDGELDGFTGFRWTSEGGMEPFGDTSGGESEFRINGLSSQGTFVVGRIRNRIDGTYQAFLWSESMGFDMLGHVEGGDDQSVALGVTLDGSVVVGRGMDANDRLRGFYWTRQEGLVPMDTLPGDTQSDAWDISADGRTIVGGSYGDSSGAPFLWSEQEGMVSLGVLPGDEQRGWALAVSSDGSVVVGASSSARVESNEGFFEEPFRWTESNGIESLGEYPEEIVDGEANDVSDNGNVIVGQYWVSDPGTFLERSPRAFVWIEESGVMNLQDLLVEGGAQGLEGWTLGEAKGISGNGLWVVGFGENPEGNNEAFRARLSSDVVPMFQINAGLNDAWFNLATAGQGFFIIVFPDLGLVFLAWFTFDAERPPESIEAILGEPGHRWLTALGPFEGNTALLDIEVTSGGVFNSPEPIPEQVLDGTIELTFENCKFGIVKYNILSAGLSGEVPIQRLANDNVTLCEALLGAGAVNTLR